MIIIAHFAKISTDGIVEQIIVVNNSDCGDLDFPESEAIGVAFINQIGLSGNYKQTSYNANFRGKYASIGDKYDNDLDEFISPISLK